MDILKKIAQELDIKLWQVEATVKLIDEGNTIPFIARYRKEAHGSLNDEQLRNLHERLVYLRNLEEKKAQVLASIEEQGKLTDELKEKITKAETQVVVDDLYRPYRPKRRTRATIAKEKGLDGLAAYILEQECSTPVEDEAEKYISEEKEVENAKDAINGAKDIIAEEISDNAEYRMYIRKLTFEEGKLLSGAKDEKAQSVYEMYYDYQEEINKVAGHRVLALNRGEKEKFLVVKMEAPEEKKNVFELFGVLFTNRAFVGIVVSALVFLLVQMTLSGMNNYIYPNYFNSAKALSMSGLLGCGVVLVMSTFVTKLAAKFGKKELAVVGAFIGAGSMFIAYFVHTTSVAVFIALYMLAYAGMSFFNIMCWAMIIDVIDDIEVKKNIRSDGTVYSVYSFARKLGQAAANGLTGLLLSIVGYSSATAFDPDVVNGIYDVTTLFPAIGFLVLAASLAFLYPLSKKAVQANVDAIAERKAQ